MMIHPVPQLNPDCTAVKLERRLTVATAADWRYGRCATQLLRSAQRHLQHRAHRWIFYDLGLSAVQRERMIHTFPWVEIRTFNFSDHPPHFKLEHETWAWKVWIIRTLVHELCGPMLWLDSATLLHSSLADVQQVLDTEGVYVLASQTAVGLRCDPLTLERLAPPLEILHVPERAAGVVGLDGARPDVRAFADEWLRLAEDPSIIAPRSPSLPYHKDDQSLLSLLLIQQAAQGFLKLPALEIDISSVNPVRWMSSRNKVAHWVPEWMDVFVRGYWRISKVLDRAWLRIVSFEADHLSGWYRWIKEHFTVYVARLDGQLVCKIPSPRNTYFADPFLLRHAGRMYLLVEAFRYDRNVGRIVAMELDASLAAGAAHELPLPGGHNSFPFVFEHDGRIHMVPETASRRSVDLYVFDRFPDAPRLVRRLLYGIDAADTIVFQFEGRFWLMTSLREAQFSNNRFLAIYYFDELDRDSPIPHPVNQLKLYGDRPHSWGRCAGPIIRSNNRLFRPIHTSTRYYGECMGWMRIDKLTPDSFAESLEGSPPEDLAFSLTRNLHHLSTADGVVAYDHRDRAGYRQGLGSMLRRSA